MRGFTGLMKRNILIYFKDIQAVLFSLLTSIIVLALYLLFLKGTFLDALENSMRGLESIVTDRAKETLVSGILLSGVLGSALITVPYNCLSTIVKDREKGIDFDICATPIKRWQIVLSYFLASTMSAFLMTAAILTIGLVILSGNGDLHMTVGSLLLAYGTVLLGAVSATAFFIIFVLFLKSSSASGAFFGMLSAASGFVIGAYLPVSQFSSAVQTVCNMFPASQVTSLLRNALLNGVLDAINKDINGLDGGMFATSIQESFTFRAVLFDRCFTVADMGIYVAAVTVLCVGIMIVVYSKTYKHK